MGNPSTDFLKHMPSGDFPDEHKHCKRACETVVAVVLKAIIHFLLLQE